MGYGVYLFDTNVVIFFVICFVLMFFNVYFFCGKIFQLFYLFGCIFYCFVSNLLIISYLLYR